MRVPHPTNVRVLPVLVCGALWALGCANVLGIEDLSEDSAPGGGASGGSASDGGSNGSGGTSPSGGSTSNGGTSAGGSAPQGGDGGEPASGGSSGSGNGGNGGSGGSSQNDTVHGKLIDLWRRPLPDVPLLVGSERVTTDGDGEFEVSGVAAEYDVSLVVTWSSGYQLSAGWVFQGLTRRDPVLQVATGLDERSATINVYPQNIMLGENDVISVALGGPDVDYTHGEVSAAGFEGSSVYWRGVSSTQASAQALAWTRDEDDRPTAYLAYTNELVPLVNGGEVDIELDLTPSSVMSGTIAGTLEAEYLRAYVRFATGSSIMVLDEYLNSAPFSVLVPSIPNSSITLAAANGGYGYGPFSVVHRDGLAAPATGIELIPPSPVGLIGPPDGASGVNGETKFVFQGKPAGAEVYLLHFVDQQADQDLYIVTKETSVTLPPVLDGDFQLVSGHEYIWEVMTQGEPKSMDDVTGEDGLLDAFFLSDDPFGPRQGSGVFTSSGVRSFIYE